MLYQVYQRVIICITAFWCLFLFLTLFNAGKAFALCRLLQGNNAHQVSSRGERADDATEEEWLCPLEQQQAPLSATQGQAEPAKDAIQQEEGLVEAGAEQHTPEISFADLQRCADACRQVKQVGYSLCATLGYPSAPVTRRGTRQNLRNQTYK